MCRHPRVRGLVGKERQDEAIAGRGQQVKKGMFSRQKRLLARSQKRREVEDQQIRG